MLASIVPFGERARNRRWGVTVAAYLVGSLVAGTALGTTFGLAGDVVLGDGLGGRTLFAVAALACAAGAAFDLAVGGLPLPTVRRQVNEDWLNRYRGWVCGVGFGFQLGLGVVTIVTTATVYLVFVLAFLSASWVAGAALGATFGLVRALPLLLLHGVTTPDRLRQAHRRMQGWAPAARRAAVGVQCAAAGLGTVVAVRP
jgi:hypothetical protein